MTTHPRHGVDGVDRSRRSCLVLALALILASCSGSEPTEVSITVGPPSNTGDAPTSTSSAPDVLVSEDAAGASPISLEWVEASISGETYIDQVLVTEDGYLAYLHDHQVWTSVDGIAWVEGDLVVESDDEVFFMTDVVKTPSGYAALGATVGEDTRLLKSRDGFRWTSHPVELEQPEVSDFGVESVLDTPTGGLILVGSFLVDDSDGHHHETLIWTSEDEQYWSLVEVPFQPDGFFHILSTGNALVAYSDPGILWISSDGVIWEEQSIEELAQFGSVAYPGVALWDGQLVMAVFDHDEGAHLLTSADGREWSRLPSHELLESTDEMMVLPGFGAIAAGPYGVALTGILQPAQPPEPDVIIERDGLNLTVQVETFTFTITDAVTGEVLAEGSFFDDPNVEIPDDGTTVTFFDPTTGERLIAVTSDEFERAREQAYERAGIEPPDAEDFIEIPTLWFSPDGQRWVSVPSEEITGPDNSFERVIVGHDSILLQGRQGSEFEHESSVFWTVTFAEGQ